MILLLALALAFATADGADKGPNQQFQHALVGKWDATVVDGLPLPSLAMAQWEVRWCQ
jgi:hypothetical protein